MNEEYRVHRREMEDAFEELLGNPSLTDVIRLADPLHRGYDASVQDVRAKPSRQAALSNAKKSADAARSANVHLFKKRVADLGGGATPEHSILTTTFTKQVWPFRPNADLLPMLGGVQVHPFRMFVDACG